MPEGVEYFEVKRQRNRQSIQKVITISDMIFYCIFLLSIRWEARESFPYLAELRKIVIFETRGL